MAFAGRASVPAGSPEVILETQALKPSDFCNIRVSHYAEINLLLRLLDCDAETGIRRL